MKYYIIGGRGKLGGSLLAELVNELCVVIDRSIYEDWSNTGSSINIFNYFEKEIAQKSVLIVAAGLLDPTLPTSDIFRINYQLPINIINACVNFDVKVVTIGTIMENLTNRINPYIESKKLLNSYIRKKNDLSANVIHIQTHTLFGIGQPLPFMFLGQMFAALQQNSHFNMTSGFQLREYHHYTDEAKAIKIIIDKVSSGIVNLSNGTPVFLRDLAESVFKFLNKEELLNIGALPNPAHDNFGFIYPRLEILTDFHFRDCIPTISDYIKECLFKN